MKKQVTENVIEQVQVELLKSFREGHKIRFHGALKCPACETPLLLDYVIVSSYPYIHTDYSLICLRCGYKALFGIAEDPILGMELIIWDRDPPHVLSRALKEETPICPFHLKKMRMTKIFGDYIRSDGTIRIQWKCSKWFLTEHRDVPHR